MGAYLYTGIVQTAFIPKDRIRKLELQEIQQLLTTKENINLNKYDFQDDEENYIWEIKENNLIEGLVPFLRAQFFMYDKHGKNYHEKLFKDLEELQTKDDIIKYAEEVRDYDFQKLSFTLSSYIMNNKFGESPVYYELLNYFMDGKIIMESYANILNYFENLIRLQVEKYPIADCVKVIIE